MKPSWPMSNFSVLYSIVNWLKTSEMVSSAPMKAEVVGGLPHAANWNIKVSVQKIAIPLLSGKAVPKEALRSKRLKVMIVQWRSDGCQQWIPIQKWFFWRIMKRFRYAWNRPPSRCCMWMFGCQLLRHQQLLVADQGLPHCPPLQLLGQGCSHSNPP